MPICTISNENAKVRQVFRAINGDIHVKYYCYSYIQGSGRNKSQKKLTHPECKENSMIIYRNGEEYNENFKIQKENDYPNLIGCWCNEYLRFSTPVEAQNHRLGKHPEEFEN
jgi:hypothetical protein